MAKAADVPLDPAEPFAEAAARVVSVRARELFEHSEGVLDTTDIERVHAMRVASRRLRAALEVFAAAFPKHEFKPVLRDVKRIADALGERRDPDVQLAHFSELRDRLDPEDQAGVDLLLDRLRYEQHHGNEVLAAELGRIRDTDLQGRLQALAAMAR
jgi:CHAD domain-containing protein